MVKYLGLGIDCLLGYRIAYSSSFRGCDHPEQLLGHYRRRGHRYR